MFVACAEDVSFEGHTLIMPSVSHANLGQLTVDLMLSSCMDKARKVGHLLSVHATPFVGNDAFSAKSPGTLSSNLEVWQSTSSPVSWVQLRASLASGREEAFAKDLAEWAKSVSVARVLVLSGADSTTRGDDELVGAQVRVASNGVEDTFAGLFNDIGIPSLKAANTDSLAAKPVPAMDCVGVPVEDPVEDPKDPSLPEAIYEAARATFSVVQGTGYAQRFFRRMEEAAVPATMLLMFVHEGDNRSHAAMMASAVEGVTHVCFGDLGAGAGAGAGPPPGWKPPSSWRAAYGPPVDAALYG